MRQIILDTETTGLEPALGHRIIEIGCIELVNRRFTGHNFHQYINPQRKSDPEALKKHGIRDEFLADKPVFADIAEQLFEYLQGAELVIHNAQFDMGFLNHEFQLLKKSYQPLEKHCSVVDTLALARKKHPGQRLSLDALCKRYQIDNSHRQFHGALLDAKLLAHVYLAMTGGQTTLFSKKLEVSPQTLNQTATMLEKVEQPLTVIYADTKELAAHDNFLTLLRQQNNGACVWDTLA